MVFNMKENKTVNRFSLNSLFVSVVSLDGKLGMEWGFATSNAQFYFQCSPSDIAVFLVESFHSLIKRN